MNTSAKKNARLRRARQVRSKMKFMPVVRLSVHRTSRHIYAQLLVDESRGVNKVVACASTLEQPLRGKNGGNLDAAKKIGLLIAERAKQAGIDRVAFDRSGFKFHGRIKALADAARQGGLNF